MLAVGKRRYVFSFQTQNVIKADPVDLVFAQIHFDAFLLENQLDGEDLRPNHVWAQIQFL